jgi:hypothetical protein
MTQQPLACPKRRETGLQDDTDPLVPQAESSTSLFDSPVVNSVIAVTGITNKSLRASMTVLLGWTAYTRNQASYDLARLRVKGLITRISGKDRYRLTAGGLRLAIFYTKLHNRLLRPLTATDQPPAPTPLRKALHTIDIHINETIDQARLLPKPA